MHQFKLGFTFLLTVLVVELGCARLGYDIATPDQAALMTMAHLSKAEADFFAKVHRYGALAEIIHLCPEIGSRMIDASYAAHKFSIVLTGDGYLMRADIEDNRQAKFSYYCDETGVVRESHDGMPASSNSRAVR